MSRGWYLSMGICRKSIHGDVLQDLMNGLGALEGRQQHLSQNRRSLSCTRSRPGGQAVLRDMVQVVTNLSRESKVAVL